MTLLREMESAKLPVTDKSITIYQYLCE